MVVSSCCAAERALGDMVETLPSSSSNITGVAVRDDNQAVSVELLSLIEEFTAFNTSWQTISEQPLMMIGMRDKVSASAFAFPGRYLTSKWK